MDSNNKIQDKEGETKKHVDGLLVNISKSKKELEEIRKTCQHKGGTDIVNDPNNEGFSLRKICKICKSAVGYPTKEEMKSAGYGEMTDNKIMSGTASSA